jgi:uncharacterized Tic20 family protein
MEARIVQYDPTTGAGVANTEDGQQYAISIHQWRSTTAPAVGQAIDITLEDGAVTAIFVSPSGSSPVGSSSDNDNLIALLTHIGGIFFGLIPSLVVYLAMKDSPFVRDSAREALNWQITVTIAMVVSFILIFVVIGFLFVWIVAIANVVLCIIAAVKASSHEVYRYPMTLRLVK